MSYLPLVSIVITNYNRVTTIGKAIESALQQDYPNLEIIISDNCSSDNSHNIITKYINDSRVKYFRNESNIGMLGNFKICFEERSKGEYISIVNSDDEYINPQFISQSVALIQKYHNVVVVSSNFISSFGKRKVETFYYQYDEFYYGIEFLKMIDLRLGFGWAGIVMNRQSINSIKPFETNIVLSDLLSNLQLMLIGNICINKNTSYLYNLHNFNEGGGAYRYSETQKIFNYLNNFYLRLAETTTKINAETITQKLQFFFIEAAYKDSYLNNRKEYKKIVAFLNTIDTAYLSRYKKLRSTQKAHLLYFFPFIGHTLTKIKKSIFN